MQGWIPGPSYSDCGSSPVSTLVELTPSVPRVLIWFELSLLGDDVAYSPGPPASPASSSSLDT